MTDALVERCLDEVTALRADLVAAAARFEAALAAVHPAHREGAANLVHYLGLRHRDLRPLQKELASLGLSSLGRAEAHVLATVDGVLHLLHDLSGRPWGGPTRPEQVQAFHRGKQLLEEHTAALLGPRPRARFVRIMVTLPSEAADDPALIRALLEGGMDCARINCAHDDVAAWTRMAGHVRRASADLSRPCAVLFDLGGPKLRTGALAPGPKVLKLKPRRDARGAVLAPARVWLTPDEAPRPAPTPAPALRLPGAWLARLDAGDALRLRDLRGRRRRLRVEAREGDSAWATTDRTCYLAPGLTVARGREVGHLGDLPPLEARLRLRPGDRLRVTRDATPGAAPAGEVPFIPCTLPEALGMVRAGEPVWFDDGRLGGTIEQVGPEGALVRIDHGPEDGAWLGADKGMNLPRSALALPGLTDKDLRDLDAVAPLADLIGLSFVNGPDDVAALRDALAARGSAAGILLKIETRRGFDRLPLLVLEAMRSERVGLMIARGDLAVECGWERLAEVQEELLCVCEAAQVPVVWATQVLETMSRTGRPTRAEITDAAMSMRAECVMLNKGPFILETLRALDDVIRRMQGHQSKRFPKLRALHLSDALGP